MHEIKAIGVLQTAKVMSAVYLAVAAAVAFIVGVGILFRGHAGRALFVIFVVPILYGVGSFLVLAVVCSVYNLVAARLGGVELELSAPPAPQP